MTSRIAYLRALRKEFRGSAPIYPKTEVLELGDYGIYQNGKFTSIGNIFKDFDLRLNDYFDHSSATASDIILSRDAVQTQLEGDLTLEGAQINISISFESESAYILQLMQYTTESYSLSNEINKALAKKASELKWRHQFRIVQKRLLCNKLYFAYSTSRSGSIKLSGKMPSSLQIGEANLKVSASRSVGTASWIDTGKATPVVDFVIYKPNTCSFATRKMIADNRVITKMDDLVPAIDNFDDDIDETLAY